MEPREEPRVSGPVVAPPPAGTSKAWLIGAPVAIVILIGIIWAMLAGMPFGSSRKQSQQIHPAQRPSMDTVGEGTSTGATASIGDPQDMQSEQPAPPPMISVAPPPATTTTTPPATATFQPTVSDPGVAPPKQAEISEIEARAILARYLDGRDPYHTPANCLVVRGTGYSNRGYAFDVLDHCQSQRLGAWRVDAVTRDLFEQKPDGRYLHP